MFLLLFILMLYEFVFIGEKRKEGQKLAVVLLLLLLKQLIIDPSLSSVSNGRVFLWLVSNFQSAILLWPIDPMMRGRHSAVDTSWYSIRLRWLSSYIYSVAATRHRRRYNNNNNNTINILELETLKRLFLLRRRRAVSIGVVNKADTVSFRFVFAHAKLLQLVVLYF